MNLSSGDAPALITSMSVCLPSGTTANLSHLSIQLLIPSYPAGRPARCLIIGTLVQPRHFKCASVLLRGAAAAAAAPVDRQVDTLVALAVAVVVSRDGSSKSAIYMSCPLDYDK